MVGGVGLDDDPQPGLPLSPTPMPAAASPSASAAPPASPSHFHLLLLVERLAEAVSGGIYRDQQYEALVTELTTQFKRCQQLLYSISETLSTKSMDIH
ncbi:hypothetical protein OPV22_019216 [Ensete ventricosum]|uniref:Uncharacterized protein n=1 Tax=Ensete ventricosum TaxID=4639 RepID=A0AAV8PGL6_ENSVE|nr:hypothetical protein OPV22_019216 [Ensete ventricosum]